MLSLISKSWTLIFGSLLWAGVGAMVFWVLLILPYRRFTKIATSRAEFLEEIGFLFFTCLLGLTVGTVTALSREAAVGAVVPAILTLIGVLVGYAYSGAVTLPPVTKVTIIVSAISLMGFFLSGTSMGASLRSPWDQYSRDFELYKIKYASQLELERMKYDAELQRIARIHQAELETYKAARLRPVTK